PAGFVRAGLEARAWLLSTLGVVVAQKVIQSLIARWRQQFSASHHSSWSPATAYRPEVKKVQADSPVLLPARSYPANFRLTHRPWLVRAEAGDACPPFAIPRRASRSCSRALAASHAQRPAPPLVRLRAGRPANPESRAR